MQGYEKMQPNKFRGILAVAPVVDTYYCCRCAAPRDLVNGEKHLEGGRKITKFVQNSIDA